MILRTFFLTVAMISTMIAAEMPGRAPHSGNPVLPGYYADPSHVEYQGKHFIYATLDPWGDETLGCWESSDFKKWTYRVLNWPTKTACKSPTSGGAGVWAPSVVRAVNGKFYMYVSVRNEVWVGVADAPTGPWENALGDQPLVAQTFRPGFHMIDAEAFIDDDGQAYLYWGSGLHWKNGRCWVVKLKPDMITFDGEVSDVTPTNYFEGPFMIKNAGRYYLMYSQGITTGDTYRVHYAIGDSPLGPFTEASNSPILTTDKEANVISPGHHAVFTSAGKTYILYHRHSVPFVKGFVGRQTCVDELRFTSDRLIEKVVPTHDGPAILQGRDKNRLAATATASSEKDSFGTAAAVMDDNYATRWVPAPDAAESWLQLDLRAVKKINRQEIRLEYAWKPYLFTVESSMNGTTWTPLADFTKTPAVGSPIVIEQKTQARYLRLSFPKPNRSQSPGVWEWSAF